MAAATFVNGGDLDPERLLARGMPLEGHADNLAAVLAGGVCLTWDGHIARVAETLPFAAVAVVPKSRVRTAEARESLPDEISHRAATTTVAHAALLGAGIAAHDPELFAAALARRAARALPRARSRPRSTPCARELPTGAVGATISGSGPTVIVWTHAEQVDACAHELESQLRRRAHTPAERLADGSPPCLTPPSSSSTSTTRCSTTTPSPPTCART